MLCSGTVFDMSVYLLPTSIILAQVGAGVVTSQLPSLFTLALSNAPGGTLMQHYDTHAQEELAVIYAQQHGKIDAQQLAESPNISAFASPNISAIDPAKPMTVNAYPELW